MLYSDPTTRDKLNEMYGTIKLPKKLQTRLEDIEKGKKTAEIIMQRQENASKYREERKAAIVAKSKKHDELAKSRSQNKLTRPRFENIPDFLPNHLKKRLENYRVPTNETIERKLERADKKRQLKNETKVKFASMHWDHVEEAKKSHQNMSENMELLGNTKPHDVREISSIRLPKSLQSRLETITASVHNHTPEKILAKEAKAEEKRKSLLNKKVNACKEHSITVKTRMENKKKTQETK